MTNAIHDFNHTPYFSHSGKYIFDHIVNHPYRLNIFSYESLVNDIVFHPCSLITNKWIQIWAPLHIFSLVYFFSWLVSECILCILFDYWSCLILIFMISLGSKEVTPFTMHVDYHFFSNLSSPSCHLPHLSNSKESREASLVLASQWLFKTAL